MNHLMKDNARLLVFLAVTAIWAGPSCPRQPAPQSADGKSYVVRFEANSNFLRVDSTGVNFGSTNASASFVLFDLNRGDLRSGDEVLLLSAQDSYLRGAPAGSGSGVVTRSSGASAPGNGQLGFCNLIVVIAAQAGGNGILVDGTNVTLRAFRDVTVSDGKGGTKIVGDGCNPESARGTATFISNTGSPPTMVNGPATASQLFKLHVDRVEPYSLTRNLSAPFANPEHFSSVNLTDLDYHLGAQRDYLGGSRTYDDHTGIDFSWDKPGFRAMQEGGEAVLAVAAGQVIYVRQDREDRCHNERQSDGTTKSVCPSTGPYDTDKIENEVIIRHDDGTVSVYTHIMRDSVPVHENDRVECGQMIAKVGSAGGSSGPHLHFELRRPHDPDFWTKHPNNVQFPYFWDHSMYIDPYEIGAWKKYRNAPPNSPADRQFIPVVTCLTDANRRLAREGEDTYLRAWLAKGYLYDWCDADQGKCGSNYFCGSKGFCERMHQPGEACSNGYECTALHGCQNGVCRLGPNCTNKCPVLKGCFLDGDSNCKRDVPGRNDCRTVAGVCVQPCFRDGDGNCKIDNGPSVRQDCALECLP